MTPKQASLRKWLEKTSVNKVDSILHKDLFSCREMIDTIPCSYCTNPFQLENFIFKTVSEVKSFLDVHLLSRKNSCLLWLENSKCTRL